MPRRNSQAVRKNQKNKRGATDRLRRDVMGKSLSLPADPPRFTQMPWNNIVLSDNVKFNQTVNTKNYTASDIAGIFTAQTGDANKKDKLSFRLMRVEVWELSGKKVTLECYDLTIGLGANDFLAQLEDIPGRNHWARVGFQYPLSQSLVVFSGNDTETLVTVTADVGSTLCVRFKVLWKWRYSTLPNRRQTEIQDLKRRIEALELGLVDVA